MLSACAGTPPAPQNTDVADPACADVPCVVDRAVALSATGGVGDAVRFVEREARRLSPQSGSFCHDALHRFGSRVDLGVVGSVDSYLLTACSGGFVHGVFTAAAGQLDGVGRMVAACRDLTGEDAILCKHGYGHAASVAGGSIDAVADRCAAFAAADTAPDPSGLPLGRLCADGAFMEVASRVLLGTWPERLDDPTEVCNRFTGDAAWGCWRQLPVVAVLDGDTDTADVRMQSVASTCADLTDDLQGACAVGVAEAQVRDPQQRLWCDLLAAVADLRAFCATRATGVAGA